MHNLTPLLPDPSLRTWHLSTGPPAQQSALQGEVTWATDTCHWARSSAAGSHGLMVNTRMTHSNCVSPNGYS
jgi:hypothetical protein